LAIGVLALAALPLFAAEIQPNGPKLARAIKSGDRASALDMIAKKSADVNAA
jgi:hypothetical protein